MVYRMSPLTSPYSIYCFGVARRVTGAAEVTLPLGAGATVADLRAAVHAAYPAFAELAPFAVARNQAYATDDEALQPGDELALIPPVSGG